MKKILLIGIGNTGRGDDGLGWAFAERLREDPRLDIACRYQLQVEDADLISRYDKVWFVDASHEQVPGGYCCEPVRGEGHFSYTTHALHPEAVVQLCHQLYDQWPESYLIGISGKDFELGRCMSPAAAQHLERALDYFLEMMETEMGVSV